MKTGIELIAIERQEQIEKHGWDLAHDKDYGQGELLMAAQFCLNINNDLLWPWHDGENGIGTHFFKKIKAKNPTDRIIIAGAFCASELDRINGIDSFDFNTILLRQLLREFMLRSQCAFPESEEEIEFWDEGLKPELIKRFFDAAGFGQSYPDEL